MYHVEVMASRRNTYSRPANFSSCGIDRTPVGVAGTAGVFEALEARSIRVKSDCLRHTVLEHFDIGRGEISNRVSFGAEDYRFYKLRIGLAKGH
jgi:hypothetical protein